MDDSSASDGDVPFPLPTLASILGLKGALRLRPHGSSQKAHVVLRRVEAPEGSDDEEDDKPAVYFSLFAQKRIEVKPGKEILLAVSSPEFGDQAVVLEGDPLASDDEPEMMEPVHSIPPKMRRTWNKRAEVSEKPDTANTPHPRSYTSIAVQTQTQPASATASAQVSPPTLSISTQFQEPVSSQAPSSVPYSPNENAHQHPPGSESSSDMDRGSDRSLSPMELDSPNSSPSHSPVARAAGTPPSFSSVASMPTLSRGSSTASTGNFPRSPSHQPEVDNFPPRPSDTTPVAPKQPSTKVADNHVEPTPPQPLKRKVVIPNPFVSGGFVNTSEPQTPLATPTVEEKKTVKISSANSSQAQLPAPPIYMGDSPPPSPKPPLPPKRKPLVVNPFVSAGFMTEFAAPASKSAEPPVPTVNGNLSNDASTLAAPFHESREEPAHAGPSSKPFDALPASLPAKPLQSGTHRRRAKKRKSAKMQARMEAGQFPQGRDMGDSYRPRYYNGTSSNESPMELDPEFALPQGPHFASGSRATEPLVLSPSPPGLSASMQSNLPGTITRQQDPATHQQNATASSSSYGGVDNRISEKSFVRPQASGVTPSFSFSLPRPLARDTTVSIPEPARNVSGVRIPNRRSSPPPDPKSLATISSGPSSNPLNIKASVSMSSINTANAYGARSAAQSAKRAKPVVVGSKWPPPRHSSGSTSFSSASASPAIPTTLSPHPHTLSNNPSSQSSPYLSQFFNGASNSNATARGLSHIVSYQSPSPPPSSCASSRGQTPNWNPTETPWGNAATGDASTDEPFSGHAPINGRSTSISIPFRSAVNSSNAATQFFQPHGMVLDGAQLHNLSSQLGSGHHVAASHSFPPNAMDGDSPATMARGMKRASPDSQAALSPRPSKRQHKWPTLDSLHSTRLQGDAAELGVRKIAFNSDGSQFAISCDDRTIRIWNNADHTELARLAHNAPIVSLAWIESDDGIISLAEDGIISKWTRIGKDRWQWAKVLDTGSDSNQDDDTMCLAYARDRIAVAFPRMGVKVWLWSKGTWQPQRSILRQNVTALKFIEDGEALLGGTRDGVLWHCQVPNGTIRAYAFLKSKIHSIDVNVTLTHALVGQAAGRAHLIGIKQDDNKGKVEQVYAAKDSELQPKTSPEFSAIFSSEGRNVLFGSLEGCVLVWDKIKGNIVYGLDHGDEDTVQAVATFDRGSLKTSACLVTGTKHGHLYWWAQPPILGS